MDAQTIQATIQHAMPDADVEVGSEDGVHFQARVVSAAFAGKPPLARHRMVYATLGSSMGGDIHALSLATHTPDEVGN
ncbi:MAG: BolA/IbaG family iron-sulfur metabolism protein [Rhodanobacteraceae bacterium]